MARLPSLRMGRVPDAPALPVRDPWPGDPARGARLLQGRAGDRRRRPAAAAGRLGRGSAAPRRCAPRAHGFTWLRDLRALGTDAARLRARALVSDWIAARPPTRWRIGPTWSARGSPPGSAITTSSPPRPTIAFRQRLMARLVSDARSLSAALPAEELDARALTALKGLIAAAVALREHAGFLTRALRFLPQEIGARSCPMAAMSSAARPRSWRRCRT